MNQTVEEFQRDIITALLLRLGEHVTLSTEEIQEASRYVVQMTYPRSFQDDTIDLQIEEIKPVYHDDRIWGRIA